MNMPHANDDAIIDYVMGFSDGRDLERHIAECVMCAEKVADEARFETKLPAIAALVKDLVTVTEVTPVWEIAPARAPAPRRLAVSLVSIVGLAATVVLAAGVYFKLLAPLTPTIQMNIPDPTPDQGPPNVAPPAAVVPQAAPAVVPPSPIPTPSPSPSPAKAKTAPRPEPAAAEEKPSKKKDGFEDLLDGKVEKKEVKQTLDRDDVLSTVKANLNSIKQCADAYARSGGTLPPKLIMKWVIKPSGFTDAQELATDALKGTSVEPCVIAAVKKWRFPESESTIPVTFPFPLAQ